MSEKAPAAVSEASEVDGPLLPITADEVNGSNSNRSGRASAARRWVIDECRKFKVEMMALWYASTDARMPLAAKACATLMLVLSLSPVDIVPASIDDTGILQDFIVVPLGVTLAVKLIPLQVWEEARLRAESGSVYGSERSPPNYCAGALIVSCWLAFIWASAKAMFKLWRKHKRPHAL